MTKAYIILLCAAFAAAPVQMSAVTANGIARVIPQGASVYPDDAKTGDLSAYWDVNNHVEKISYKIPSTGYYYNDDFDEVHVDLDNVTKVVISKSTGYSYQTLTTIENPAPGSKITIDDTELAPGETCDYRAQCYIDDLCNSYINLYNVTAGAFPETVSDVTIATTEGKSPVTISFTAPTKYNALDANIDNISAITVTELVYDWTNYENVEYPRGRIDNPQPGSRQQITCTEQLSQNETHSFVIKVHAGDGVSQPYNAQFYLGNDYPDKVLNLTATAQKDGSVLVKWDAPNKGARNGYIKPEDIKYQISVKPDKSSWDTETLESNYTQTSYTYIPQSATQKSLVFEITPFNNIGTGISETTAKIVAGPAAALPYTEGFDNGEGYSWAPENIWTTATTSTSSYPQTWSYNNYVYFGSNQVKPRSGEGGFANIRYYSSNDEVTHDYLISGAIDIEGQEALKLSFCHYAVANDNTSAVAAEIAFDNGQFTTIYTGAIAAPKEQWIDVTRKVEVPQGAKTAVLRFNATNGSRGETVVIDDIKLESAQPDAIVYPASVSDFTAQFNDDHSAIDISLRAPSLSHHTLGEVHDQPLTNISKIVLLRNINRSDYSEIHTFENPAPGEVLTFSDTDLTVGGAYFYKALVYINNRSDYGEYIDSEIMVGQVPADTKDLTANSNRGKAPVTISFTVPDTDIQGNPLTEKVKATLTKYDYTDLQATELKTWTGLAAGEKVSFDDVNVIDGNNYRYSVQLFGTAGSSYGIGTDVYIGVDQPQQPSNVTATDQGNGSVLVTWTAPTEGINNGYIDTDNLTYSIYRGNGYSDYNATLIATNIRECQYIDKIEISEEEAVRYFVKAKNMGIEGFSASSPIIVIGPAATLPYFEGFNKEVGDGNIEADHSTWTTSSTDTSCVWAFAELAYFILDGQVQPLEGNGLAYAYYGHYSSNLRDDYLTSGHINLKDAIKPMLRYNVYIVPGYDTSLEMQISTDGTNFDTLETTDYSRANADRGSWIEITKDLSAYKGNDVTIRFKAHKGEYACSTAIDKISITDEPNSIAELYSGNIKVTINNRTVTITGNEALPYAITSIDGTIISSGTGNTVNTLNPGIYMITTKAGTQKTIIK